MKKIVSAILVILMIASLSGCLGKSTNQAASVGTGYPGVEFVEFYPINMKVPKNSDVVLYYSIQNNGYFDAENVQVTLYNCGDIKIGTHSWLGGEEYICNQPVLVTGENLRMPDREQGVSGEVADAEVSLRTDMANIPVGDSPHTFSARLEYNYMTTAIRDVVFTTFDNWKAKGGNIQTGILQSSSKPAPISVSINAPEQPIIITKNSEGDDQLQEFTVAVQIRNDGGGYLKGKNLSQVNLCYDPSLISVEDSRDFIDCYTEEDLCCEAIPKTDGQGCLCVSAEGDSKLNMVGLTNQWRDVSAIFSPLINNLDDDNVLNKAAVQVQDVSNFGATVEYIYMSDESTQLTLTRTS
jgi:hypothetical protein